MPAEEGEETFYDAMKREMAERMNKTRAVMDTLDPVQRVAREVISTSNGDESWIWVWMSHGFKPPLLASAGPPAGRVRAAALQRAALRAGGAL